MQAKEFTHKIDNVFYINISDKEALWRLAYRNDIVREDETIAAIRVRIESFHKYTRPVISHYKRKKLLVEINGQQSIKKVHQDILKHLKVK